MARITMEDVMKAVQGINTRLDEKEKRDEEWKASIEERLAAKETKQSRSNSKPKTKEFDWSKCTPKKDEDGYWNFRSYKCARARFMDMVGKGDQWLSKEEYAKVTKPFVDHFGPYVKKDARA